MRNNVRKFVILFLIIILFCSSIFIVSARDNTLSKDDFINDSYIEKQRENDEGGEGKKSFSEMENDFKDTEEKGRASLVILGNQVKRDGSNGFEIHPVYIILTIASLITIIMVCIIRKK
jgi:hypothetical protein